MSDEALPPKPVAKTNDLSVRAFNPDLISSILSTSSPSDRQTVRIGQQEPSTNLSKPNKKDIAADAETASEILTKNIKDNIPQTER